MNILIQGLMLGFAYVMPIGDQIAAGKKSVSFSLRLRSHEGTLTDEQADAAMKRVLKALAAMDAVLREA